METGMIAKWHKKEGDLIAAGDIICEVETDKAVVDYEATDDAYLAKVLRPAGSGEIKVGEPIFVTVAEADDVAAFADFSADAAALPASESAAVVAPTASVAAAAAPTPTAPAASAPASSSSSSGRVVASPLAKKVGFSLSGLLLLKTINSAAHRLLATLVLSWPPSMAPAPTAVSSRPTWKLPLLAAKLLRLLPKLPWPRLCL